MYAALSIGTARPSEAEMQGVAHHLLGFLPLEESYSVARYVEDASHAAGSIHARGRLPILCGGTGLYLQAFLDNLTFTEQGVDPALRAALKARAQQEGGQALLDELRAFDPETAAACTPTIPADRAGHRSLSNHRRPFKRAGPPLPRRPVPL